MKCKNQSGAGKINNLTVWNADSSELFWVFPRALPLKLVTFPSIFRKRLENYPTRGQQKNGDDHHEDNSFNQLKFIQCEFILIIVWYTGSGPVPMRGVITLHRRVQQLCQDACRCAIEERVLNWTLCVTRRLIIAQMHFGINIHKSVD